MNVRTYRAKSMQEALALVRSELGAKASVLKTREVRPRGLSRWWGGTMEVEVVASANVTVPSRLPSRQPILAPVSVPEKHAGLDLSTASSEVRLPEQLNTRQRRSPATFDGSQISTLACRLAQLVGAEIDDVFAGRLVERMRRSGEDWNTLSPDLLKSRLATAISGEIAVTGPIQVTPGARKLVALVGPTGVGKTTTIAKLAAQHHLQYKHRVGLITVDTYRVAAVEQLRTYADLMQLPMEIASTSREVQQALARMADLDLVLLDTAGRSPRDAAQLGELAALLGQTQPDEVHLVLSCVASCDCLHTTMEQFAKAGTTAVMVTKLDEATSLGNLFNLVRRWRTPISYLTTGQNVPADIMAADRLWLARAIVGMHSLQVQ